MKLGILAYATKTGLGYQTQAFHKHLNPTKTLVVDISMHNGETQYRGMYDDAYFVDDIPNKKTIQQFLTGLDVALIAETPLNYEFYTIAKAMGVKVANQVNPEFFDHFSQNLPLPDMFISPSMWKFREIDLFAKANNIKHKYLHLPVDRELFAYRQRTTKKLFHIAGKQAYQDRNGTWDFMTYVPNGTVLTQTEQLANQIRTRYRHCQVYTDIPNPASMYNFGDVMILPRRYGGNCLPLNEALSSGCPVIMPNIEPNNYLLPQEWLVKASITGNFETHGNMIDVYTVDPVDMHEKIEQIKLWDIAQESKRADEIAQSISWEVLKDEYLNTLEELANG